MFFAEGRGLLYTEKGCSRVCIFSPFETLNPTEKTVNILSEVILISYSHGHGHYENIWMKPSLRVFNVVSLRLCSLKKDVESGCIAPSELFQCCLALPTNRGCDPEPHSSTPSTHRHPQGPPRPITSAQTLWCKQ